MIKELLHSDERPAARYSDESQSTFDSFAAFFADKIAKTIHGFIASGSLPSLAKLVHGKPIGLGQFAYVSDEEASRAIRNLPPKTSPLDYIQTAILKDCSDVFRPIIASLANLSSTEGKFPDMFTVGQIMPLLKKPGVDIDDTSNYRPVTNSNTIGKLL